MDLKTVPPELDLVSMDCYGRPSYYNASTEVAWAKACAHPSIRDCLPSSSSLIAQHC